MNLRHMTLLFFFTSLAFLPGCKNSHIESQSISSSSESADFEYRDWIEVRKFKISTLFLNPSIYSKNGNQVKFWLLGKTNESQAKKDAKPNALFLMAADCKTHEVAGPLSYTFLNQSFESIETEPETNLNSSTLPQPYSGYHAAMMLICSLAETNNKSERNQVTEKWKAFYESKPLKNIKDKQP